MHTLKFMHDIVQCIVKLQINAPRVLHFSASLLLKTRDTRHLPHETSPTWQRTRAINKVVLCSWHIVEQKEELATICGKGLCYSELVILSTMFKAGLFYMYCT